MIIIATTPPLHIQMQAEMNGSWEVPVSISLTPNIMIPLSVSFPSPDSFHQTNSMKEKINQAYQSRETKYKNMNKHYLTSLQIWDTCRHRASDYPATRWTAQCKLPRRFSFGGPTSILSGYNICRDNRKNFIRWP